MAKIKHASQVGHHGRTAGVRELAVMSTDSVIREHRVRTIAAIIGSGDGPRELLEQSFAFWVIGQAAYLQYRLLARLEFPGSAEILVRVV